MMKQHIITNAVKADVVYIEDTTTGEFFRPGFRETKKEPVKFNLADLMKEGKND